MKVLMIGAGNIGCPYAEGMSASSLLENKNLQIYDRNEHKLKAIEEKGLLQPLRKLEDCLPQADIIFLAVKPNQIAQLFDEMRPLINNNQVFVSIMAGIKIKTVMAGLEIEKVVRAMPNLPAKIGKGVTCFTNSKAIIQKELDNVHSLINMTGTAIHVKNQDFIDASTAISGSGPAYVFYFIQALIDSLIKTGYSQPAAQTLVTAIFENAFHLLNESKRSPFDLMEQMSKENQNIRSSIEKMNQTNVGKFIEKGAFAAYERAIELGKPDEK